MEAVADFYEREVVNLKRVDPAKIPDFDRTLERWIRLAEKRGRAKAAERLRRVKRF